MDARAHICALQKHVKYGTFVFIATLFPLYLKVLITLILISPFQGNIGVNMEFYPGNLVRFNTSWLLPCGALAVQEGMALNKAARFSTGSMGFPDLTAPCKCRTTQTPGMLCQRRQHSSLFSQCRGCLMTHQPNKHKKKAVKLSFQCVFQTRRCHALQIINGRIL